MRQWTETAIVDANGTDIIPTLSNQALFLSCLIDVKERRDTATADVLWTFLQTKSEGEVIIRLD